MPTSSACGFRSLLLHIIIYYRPPVVVVFFASPAYASPSTKGPQRWLVGVGTILFLCMSLLTTMIYDQSKEIEELQLAGWKYWALRATLPADNANVMWLERNVWAGNKDGIRHCQQFAINYENIVGC